MVRISDGPDMTSDVYSRRNATNQTKHKVCVKHCLSCLSFQCEALSELSLISV